MSEGRSRVPFLILAALGVVFGDIGTSPLYPLRACFSGLHGIPVTTENVLGVLSLIFWSLIITVAILIVLFVVRRRGTGGMGAVFGPIMIVWFVTIALLGLPQILDNTVVLSWLSPAHAYRFFADQDGARLSH